MSRELAEIKNKSSGRLEYVDSIRGIAAFGVVIAHFIFPLYINSSSFLQGYFDLGKIGVVLFFIISGFIIPFSFQEKNGGIKSFLISRFFRLYPAYWFSLFVFLLFSFFSGKVFPNYQIIANITMFQAAIGIKDIVGVYWTLFIELIFYGLCTFLFILGRLNKVRVNFFVSLVMLFIALLLGGIKHFLDIYLPVAIPLALSLMMLGGIWREFVLQNDLFAKKLCFIYFIIYFFCMPAICYWAYGEALGGRYLITYYVSIILFLLCTTKLKINNKWFVYLGTISYSVYLMHPAVLISFEYYSEGFSPGRKLFFAIISILITLPISYLTYKFIELPSINLGRRLKKH